MKTHHGFLILVLSSALSASCSTANAPATNNPGNTTSSTPTVDKPTVPPGVQGATCELGDTCKDNLVCRFGGKSYPQCLRPEAGQFDFGACVGEGIDGFETRQVDCSAFVVNNKTETSSTSCPLPVVESGQACKQVLVGRFLQIGPYIDCTDHYIALNRDDWTIDVNDDFVYCAATGQLGATCEARLQLVSGQRYVQDHGSHGSPVTARELCQFHRMGCQIEDWGYDHGTVIKCPARE